MIACPRCGERNLWQLHSLPDRGGALPEPLAPTLKMRATATVGNGRFELHVCTSCGHSRWYARGVQPDPELTATNHRCADCDEHRFWRVRTLRERDGKKVPVPLRVAHQGKRGVGHFELYLCRGCGRTLWYARAVEGKVAHLPEVLGPCAGCSGEKLLQVEQIEEEARSGPAPLCAVLRQGTLFARALGWFEVRFCAACGLADWFARGLERLKADPRQGIVRVRADAAPISSGPYR